MNQVRPSVSSALLLLKSSMQGVINCCAGVGVSLSMTVGLSLSAGWVAPHALAESDTLTLANFSESTQTTAGLEDGTYLFGQAPEREQLGMAYVVLEIIDQQAIGAFYMPSSSFDCFYGEVTANQLDLTVVDSYQQTHHPYTVALEATPSLVAGAGAGTSGLVGFYQLSELTEQDHTLLNTCQVQYGELI